MNLFDVFSNRNSCREFSNKEINTSKMNSLLKTCNWGPSAGNIRGCEFHVFNDPIIIKKISKACYNQEFIKEAPIVIIIFAKPSAFTEKYGARGEMYALQEADIVSTYLMLSATALGLGSCWLGAFDDNTIIKIIVNSTGLKPVCVMPIGYRKE